MKIKSAKYLSDGAIEIVQTELGDPGEGEIQVAGEICGICSWDVATCREGAKFRFPAPPGHEGIGRVLKVGGGVENFKEGDRVTNCGFHTAQNISVRGTYKIPPTKLAPEFWLVEPVSCVVTGLDHCRLQAGQRVVMIGCGFMGLLMLQGLTRSFASEVVAIDVDQKRLDLAKVCGAKEVHNVATANMPELINDLKSRNIDVVVDTSGTQQGIDLASKIVREGGLINLFGWIKGEAATFDPTLWHMRGVTIVNSSPAAKMRDPFPPAIQLINNGFFDLSPLVTHFVPLDEYPSLMKKILSGDKSYVKGVIKMG